MKLRNRLPFFLRLLNKIRTLFGIPPLTLTNAKARNLLGLTAYGGLEQNGTPTPGNPIPLICNNGEIKVDANGNVYCDGLQETLRIVESNSTATTEMLLKLGDYVDSQDILNGIVNRQLGVLVLKGNENWELYGDESYNKYFRLLFNKIFSEGSAIAGSLCTHAVTASISLYNTLEGFSIFVPSATPTKNALSVRYNIFNNDVTTFKQWLSDCYNNGNPVIIVYAKKTESTESTTPQSMLTVEGSNTLEIQQASLSNLEVEVTYKEK